MNNLRVQGLCVVDWCSMCKQSGEFADHLLLHCCFAYDIWSMVFGMIGLVWVMPQSALASWSVEQGGLAIVKIQLFGVLYRHDSTYSYMANTTFKCLASSYTLFNLH